VPPEAMQRFLAISTTNAAASRKEAGVLDFEVLIPQDTPDTVMFIETYRNAAASDVHQRSAHFMAFKEGVKQTGAKESAVIAKRYMP
jgi:(4S)-4-hydroxy-5-phosphonooxypentane-2,3-dione isomerase